MKFIRTAVIVCIALGAIPAIAQTPVYHANLLGLSDGRTNIQVEYPTTLNR